MRNDMFKVIVERPRCVNSNAYKGDGRPFRNREDGPLMLGMKKGYSDRKWLNENLAPLKRFLEKQVNRPWDKVHGEIRAAIDGRSTVKQHVLQHIDNFVAVQTRWEQDEKGGGGKGGRVMARESSWSGRYVPLEESFAELFVHPLTGILLRNRRYTSWDARAKQKRHAAEQGKLRARRIISERVQLHCIDGIWYEVMLDVLPPPRVIIREENGALKKECIHDKRWDVMRKAWVAREAKQRVVPPGSNQDCYGCATLYAVKKRQLSSREIQTHRLHLPQQKQKARKGLLLLLNGQQPCKPACSNSKAVSGQPQGQMVTKRKRRRSVHSVRRLTSGHWRANAAISWWSRAGRFRMQPCLFSHEEASGTPAAPHGSTVFGVFC